MIRQQSHLDVEEEQPCRRRHTINSSYRSDRQHAETRANVTRFVRLLSAEGIADSDRHTLEPAELPVTVITMETTAGEGEGHEIGVEAIRGTEGVESETVSSSGEEEEIGTAQVGEGEVKEEEVKGEQKEEEEEEMESQTPFLDRLPSIEVELRDSPAFQFITRPDLYKFANVGNS